MNETGFSYLRKRSRRTLRIIERSRRYALRVRLMKKFGMSKGAAKALSDEYHYVKPAKQ